MVTLSVCGLGFFVSSSETGFPSVGLRFAEESAKKLIFAQFSIALAQILHRSVTGNDFTGCGKIQREWQEVSGHDFSPADEANGNGALAPAVCSKNLFKN
jgi:hypothetical protein